MAACIVHCYKSHGMFYAEPTYQFDQGDYMESEGSGSAIVVNVQQIVSSVQDVHLLLVPLTYDQYIAQAATDPTLANIDCLSWQSSWSMLNVSHCMLDWILVTTLLISADDVRQDFDMYGASEYSSQPTVATFHHRWVSFPIFDDAINELARGVHHSAVSWW